MKHIDFNKHVSLHLIGNFSLRKKIFLLQYLLSEQKFQSLWQSNWSSSWSAFYKCWLPPSNRNGFIQKMQAVFYSTSWQKKQDFLHYLQGSTLHYTLLCQISYTVLNDFSFCIRIACQWTILIFKLFIATKLNLLFYCIALLFHQHCLVCCAEFFSCYVLKFLCKLCYVLNSA